MDSPASLAWKNLIPPWPCWPRCMVTCSKGVPFSGEHCFGSWEGRVGVVLMALVNVLELQSSVFLALEPQGSS